MPRMDSLDLDDPLVALMVRFHLEDLEDLANSSKGKGRAGEKTDTELAFEVYKSELEPFNTLISDRTMCRSIAQAVATDGPLLRHEAQNEEQAARDRQLAQSLSSHGRMMTTSATEKPPTDNKAGLGEDSEQFRRLQAMNLCPSDATPSEQGDQGESSSWGASRAGTSVTIPCPTCTSCLEEIKPYDAASLPCKDYYCRGCLAGLFQASMTDETLYPPRCCRQKIPLEDIKFFLPPDLVEEFLVKKLELDETNRTYCHEPTCSTFIPATTIVGDVATCSKCERKTCSMCKGALHDGNCPKDEAIQELLRLAATNGWQRCNTCRRIVELEIGCNHMSKFNLGLNQNPRCKYTVDTLAACLCKAEFCYLCGAKWKTCGCVQWDEARLYQRAVANVNRRGSSRAEKRPETRPNGAKGGPAFEK